MVIFHDPEVPPATVGAMITLPSRAVIARGAAGVAPAEEEEVEGVAVFGPADEKIERISIDTCKKQTNRKVADFGYFGSLHLTCVSAL